MPSVLFNQIFALILVVIFAGIIYLVMTSRSETRPWWVCDVRTFISCFLVVSVVALIFVLIQHPIKDADDITKAAIGALLSVGFATIVNFWFSTSKSSADKDDTINRAVANSPIATPPAAPVSTTTTVTDDATVTKTEPAAAAAPPVP